MLILFYLLPFFSDNRTASIMRMFQPDGRIFIQQLTVIPGSMFLVLGGAKIFVLIFALVRIFVEVYINFDNILNQSLGNMDKQGDKK